MRLLLDTHALLWFVEGSDQLSGPARAAIEDGGNQKLVSHATPWEVAIKIQTGKLILGVAYNDLFPSVVLENGFAFWPPDFRHYYNLIQLPRHHGDPFDRLMIAQALVDALTLVTADQHIPKYGVRIIW
jgi:PIN domain nuclease of toxin-antitoxin system